MNTYKIVTETGTTILIEAHEARFERDEMSEHQCVSFDDENGETIAQFNRVDFWLKVDAEK